jgi:SAM-dependent methyltransferase
MLALHRSCARVDGYDFSPGMLEIAAGRVVQTGDREAFHFVETDLASIDLPSRGYDRIVTFGAWGHVLPEWRERLVVRVLSALKEGGVFYTVTADPSGPWDLDWWKAALFDAAIKARNWLLGDPFHMYYLLNDTLTVKRLFESAGPCQVRLEPIPRFPHPRLTLLMARSP